LGRGPALGTLFDAEMHVGFNLQSG
jgi:hypothetical protein